MLKIVFFSFWLFRFVSKKHRQYASGSKTTEYTNYKNNAAKPSSAIYLTKNAFNGLLYGFCLSFVWVLSGFSATNEGIFVIVVRRIENDSCLTFSEIKYFFNKYE